MTLTFEFADLLIAELPDKDLGGLTWREWYDRAWAWGEWHKASCVERNGGHDWHAELPCREDGGSITLFCPNCPAGVDDLYVDGVDLIHGEVDGIPVENGMARSLDYYTAPVNVRVVDYGGYSYGSYYREPDPQIEVTSRAHP
jgi:hypothetical protein